MTQCSKCSKKLTPRQSPQRQVSAMSCDISKVTFSSRWVDWWGLPPSRTITQPLWHSRDAGSFGRAAPLSQQRLVSDMACDISKYWFSSRWVDWWGPQRPTRTLWKICNLLTSWKIYIFSLGDAATKYYFSFAFFLAKRLFILEIIQFC